MGTQPAAYASMSGISPATAVRLELAKLHRLRTMPVVSVLGVTAAAFAAPLSVSARQTLTDPALHPWEALLLQYALINALFSPILVAVLASRLTDIEHACGGWYLSATAGLTPGRLCRAKLAALALVLVPTLALQTGLLVGATVMAGTTVPLSTGVWAAYTAGLIAVDLAMCALHILLAAVLDNQILCVGAGMLGAFIAVYLFLAPPWLARLLPWGYWALICPISQTGTAGGDVAVASPPLGWIAGFLALAVGCFYAITARLDRIER
ncbi:ABC transporter permease [Actinomyces procaprae]|uniref:ABC transporter permease n=1 Tax=Actinomyces procaprae TaxID=2560010 RepID=UPI00195ACF9B|nr:ABC transporter permease [Actinomyces procaprae]